MKLSSRARYALRAMMVLAREGKGERPVNLGVVAERTAISRPYLEQVVMSLKSAGLLRAISGKNGGHLLARPAKSIRLSEIVEAAIGPINIVECVGDPDSCMKAAGCDCRGLYALINRRVRETFASFTLADLADHSVKKAVARELAQA